MVASPPTTYKSFEANGTRMNDLHRSSCNTEIALLLVGVGLK